MFSSVSFQLIVGGVVQLLCGGRVDFFLILRGDGVGVWFLVGIYFYIWILFCFCLVQLIYDLECDEFEDDYDWYLGIVLFQLLFLRSDIWWWCQYFGWRGEWQSRVWCGEVIVCGVVDQLFVVLVCLLFEFCQQGVDGVEQLGLGCWIEC